ncbi:MAG: hypothetical protein EDQ89_11925, partial [Acidobacteria bacterium]
MTKRIALTATILAALAVAVPAFAGITVYSNSFKAKSSYKAITKQSGKGKRCKREWRKKSALGVAVKGGKQNCALKTPVAGDSAQPDLIVKALAKLTGRTDKAARKGAYLGVSVRASRKDGYVFRVIPKARKWELLAGQPGKVTQPLAVSYLSSLHQGEDQALLAIHALEYGDYAMAISLFKRALSGLNRSRSGRSARAGPYP